MRNENEIKRFCLAQFTKFLKAGEIAAVVIEVFCKFVPNKDDCFQLVRTKDFHYPVAQVFRRHREGFNLSFTGHGKDLVHQSVKRRVPIGFQLAHDGIHIISTKEISITSLDVDVETLFVFLVRKIADHRLSQRVSPPIFHACLSKGPFHALLNSQDQVVIPPYVRRAVPMDRQHLPTVLDALKVVIQVHIKMVPFEVLFCFFRTGI